MELNLNFKKLGDHSPILELAEYAREQIRLRPNTKIYVGSDSQNSPSVTTLATVIVFHYDGRNGAHVVYRSLKLKKIRDSFSRLWLEVTSSVEIAQFLRDEGLKIEFVDLDLNADPKWQSNTVLRSALGYVESLGFEPRWKPNQPFSTRVADTLCR